MSSYRKNEDRGGPLPEGDSGSYAEPGIPPLDWESYDEPTAGDWMGLTWTDPKPLSEVDNEIPAEDGVYRIWNADSPLPLEYIGETANLRSRLRTHSRERDVDLLFAYATPGSIDAKHKRLEAETDLLGAHWIAVRAPPSDQH
jgi:hypothetical protein